MSELRLAGALLVAVSGALLGLAARRDMKQRVLFLQDFQKGLLLLRQEMEYMKTPLEEAMHHTCSSLREPLASFFRETGKCLEELPGTPLSVLWEEGAEKYLGTIPLKTADRALIRTLGKQLELLEPGGNKGLMAVYEQRLEELLREAADEYGNKAQLYCKLGIMGGIFLAVLFL